MYLLMILALDANVVHNFSKNSSLPVFIIIDITGSKFWDNMNKG